jgi:hypothetical protein
MSTVKLSVRTPPQKSIPPLMAAPHPMAAGLRAPKPPLLLAKRLRREEVLGEAFLGEGALELVSCLPRRMPRRREAKAMLQQLRKDWWGTRDKGMGQRKLEEEWERPEK